MPVPGANYNAHGHYTQNKSPVFMCIVTSACMCHTRHACVIQGRHASALIHLHM